MKSLPTEQPKTTDTEALLATVRNFIEDVPQYGTPEKPWAAELPDSQPAEAALDSLGERVQELEAALREIVDTHPADMTRTPMKIAREALS